MKTISRREYLMRIAWMEQQWNEPDRSDNYAMQIAAEVKRFREAFSKNPQAVALADMKIPFGRSSDQPQSLYTKPIEELTPEETEIRRRAAATLSKARWAGRLGVKVEDIESGKARRGLAPVQTLEQVLQQPLQPAPARKPAQPIQDPPSESAKTRTMLDG
mgnify:FL=1